MTDLVLSTGHGKSNVLTVAPDSVYAFDATDTDEDTRADRPAPRPAVRRSCQPRSMTNNNNPVPTGTLSEIAAIIAARLREAGFNGDEAIERNVLGLAEEAGEVVGAYRRYTGERATFYGQIAQVHATLAATAATALNATKEYGPGYGAADQWSGIAWGQR